MLVPVNLKDKIISVENNSDGFITRARVVFANGYELSVIRGWGTHGSELDLYEIAIFYNEQMIEIDGDSVLGYQSDDDVRNWMLLIANLPFDFNVAQQLIDENAQSQYER